VSGRAKGCHLERGRHRYTPFAVAQARGLAVVSVPKAVSLEAFTPAVVDQTRYSACEGCSSSGAVYTTLARAGTPLPWVPSQKGIYRLALAIDRDDPSQPLLDLGTQTNSVIRAMSEFGIHAMGPAVGNTNCDLDDTLTAEPQLGELELDAQSLLIGAYQITSSGPQKVADVKQALASGFAVRVDTEVDRAFEDWSPSQVPFGVPDYANSLGGHALYCVAYDGNLFTIRNSWGAGWGSNGNLLASAAFISQADCYAWSVRKAA
jgi:hypothetical protein